MNIVDSHAHLFLEEFSEDLPQIINRARMAGVSHICMPNIDDTTIDSLLRVCREYEGYCHPMMGLHPTSVDASYENRLHIIEEELHRPGYVAIGEVGMDLYWDRTYLHEQQTVLKLQLQWALELDLPVVIHCREAMEETLSLLEPYRGKPLRGVFHSFTGTAKDAARILRHDGFCIGVNGIVTFKKSPLPAMLPSIPLDRLLLETDAPYLAPVPHRGKRNESSFLTCTLQKVSECYGLTQEEVAHATSLNALRLFGL